MAYWLLKTEPEAYGIMDLERDGVGRWDGVRNYLARNHLRAMRRGDWAFIHHSSCARPAVVGLASIARAAYPDPTQFDSRSRYVDLSSDPDDPRWSAVDVSFVEAFRRPVALADMRADPELAGMALLKRGQRLSVMPLERAHALRLLACADARRGPRGSRSSRRRT